MTCYIELPSGMDPREINAASVNIWQASGNVIHPPIFSVGNFDYTDEIPAPSGNGILELMVKFDRARVVQYLNVGEAETISIRGALTDGREITGADHVRVINPGNSK